jgi:hypothetical protein
MAKIALSQSVFLCESGFRHNGEKFLSLLFTVQGGEGFSVNISPTCLLSQLSKCCGVPSMAV